MKLSFDPRTKLLILVLINIIVFVSPDLQTEWLCMGVIITVLLIMGAYKQAIRGVIIYASMMTALWMCSFLPGLLAGIISMTVICFRKLVPIIVFASGMIATTKVSELICAMQKLYVPNAIVISFAVTLRFFPTVKEEFACIKDAMKLRGIRLNIPNLLTRPLVVMECVFVPMMIRCANIAEELSAASITRGIENNRSRTSLHRLSFRLRDALGSFAFIALSMIAVLGGFGGLYG